MYESGASLNQIARELKYSKDKVRGTLVEGGVVLRPSNRGASSERAAVRATMVCGAAPYGFMYHNNKLVLHPKEAAVVRRIVDLRSKGLNVTDIARKLNGLKLKTRHDAAWDHSLVGRIARRCEQEQTLYQAVLK